MHILIGIIGIIFFLALAFLFSSDRKNIRWKYVGILLAIQLIFAFILLKTTMGIKVIGGISNGFNYLLLKAADGVNFVFGGIQYI
ncbi:NupC/NupG family nucleoside CNT transporter, partial [Staphylococcus aureus]|nr:NupC/NupG family nucleoside CNT transporter [Staphylococcus aureus]MCD0805003.1 NupC/NupG family nucleoside CNT transporter [Staphylococcus aureus]